MPDFETLIGVWTDQLREMNAEEGRRLCQAGCETVSFTVMSVDSAGAVLMVERTVVPPMEGGAVVVDSSGFRVRMNRGWAVSRVEYVCG